MRSFTSVKSPQKQKGLILVILIVIIALAFISYIVSELSIEETQLKRYEKTAIALKKAKEALLAYAVTYAENNGSGRGPGYLPCPDMDNDGDSIVNDCQTAGVPNIGRLPWLKFGINDIRDGANERLWYAVSENYDYTSSPQNYPGGSPTKKIINTMTRGNITIRDSNNNIINDGTTLDAAVAVIIAPGVAITRDDGTVQDRSTATGDPNDPVNYLDVDTTSGEDNADFQQGILGGGVQDGFIQGEILDVDGNVIVNDTIMVITYEDIMGQIHKRVASEIANTLNDYFSKCKTYPEAANYDPKSGTFDSASFPTPPPPANGDQRYGLLPVGANVYPVGWSASCAGLPLIGFPAWLVQEEWHRLTYYAYAHDATVQNGGDCGVPPNPICLNVNNINPPVNNARALIVFSGLDEANVGMPYPGGPGIIDEGDFFEGENDNNLTNNGTYDAGEARDYVRVIAP